MLSNRPLLHKSGAISQLDLRAFCNMPNFCADLHMLIPLLQNKVLHKKTLAFNVLSRYQSWGLPKKRKYHIWARSKHIKVYTQTKFMFPHQKVSVFKRDSVARSNRKSVATVRHGGYNNFEETPPATTKANALPAV